PMGVLSAPALEREDEDVEITDARAPSADAAAEAPAPRAAPVPIPKTPFRWKRWIAPAAAVLLAIVVLAVISALEPVALDVEPNDDDVSIAGSWLTVRWGGRLFVLPGQQVVRAGWEGYSPAQTGITVRDGEPASVRLRLATLPG